MYKVMTKLHTRKENVYAFHMVKNDQGEIVEYGVATPEEAAETAIQLLGRVGYEDLRIVDDKSYYIDLIYGERPHPIPGFYTLTYVNIQQYEPDEEVIEDIEEGETVSSIITFITPEPVVQFHLKVDGVEYAQGNPDWIEFDKLTDYQWKITYSGITRDHTVEIIVDQV